MLWSTAYQLDPNDDGPCELGEDSSAPLDWLDHGQRVPASAVSSNRANLRAVRGRFYPPVSSAETRRGSRV